MMTNIIITCIQTWGIFFVIAWDRTRWIGNGYVLLSLAIDTVGWMRVDQVVVALSWRVNCSIGHRCFIRTNSHMMECGSVREQELDDVGEEFNVVPLLLWL